MRLARSPVAPNRTKIVGPGSGADAPRRFVVAMLPTYVAGQTYWAANLLGQVPGQEGDGLGHGVLPVGALGQPVPLVAVDEQLALLAPGGQRGVDLLGLAQRHPRVVGPVDDEQRRPDLVDPGQRRGLVQELAVVGQRAVLPLAVD